MMNATGLASTGVSATWRLAQSALPTAPVVPDPVRTPRRSDRVRARAAGTLRRMAAALDPTPLDGPALPASGY